MPTTVIKLDESDSTKVERQLAWRERLDQQEARLAGEREAWNIAADHLANELHAKHKKTRRPDHRFVRDPKTGLFTVVYG